MNVMKRTSDGTQGAQRRLGAGTKGANGGAAERRILLGPNFGPDKRHERPLTPIDLQAVAGQDLGFQKKSFLESHLAFSRYLLRSRGRY